MGDLSHSQFTTAVLAKTLAAKLDQTAASKTGAIALAVGALSKQFQAVMDELRRPGADTKNELMKGIFDDE